ncbi:MAG: glutathione peroxidase [Hyphomonadaceae bacterium]|nr:glutathione peroxidase [Clostridia bacterium]
MSIYDFVVSDAEQNEVAMSDYKDKVLLIVNTATRCGLTPQYDALQELYVKYQAQGFELLDFPCNQFLAQAPETNAEIVSFCQLKFGTTFKTFAKIDVNGEHAHPLFRYLKQATHEETEDDQSKTFLQKLKDIGQAIIGTDIKWNFTKFLVDKEGNVVARFSPTVKPQDIDAKIAELIAK